MPPSDQPLLQHPIATSAKHTNLVQLMMGSLSLGYVFLAPRGILMIPFHSLRVLFRFLLLLVMTASGEKANAIRPPVLSKYSIEAK